MAIRIEVGFKPSIKDTLGENLKRRNIEDLRVEVVLVRTISDNALTRKSLRDNFNAIFSG